MNRNVLATVVIVVALLFGVFVWPGRYEVVPSLSGVYRFDRVTGAIQEAKNGEWKSGEEITKEADSEAATLAIPMDFDTYELTGVPKALIHGRIAYLDKKATANVTIGPLSDDSYKKFVGARMLCIVRLVTKASFPVSSYRLDTMAPSYLEHSGKTFTYGYTEDLPMTVDAYRAIGAVRMDMDPKPRPY